MSCENDEISVKEDFKKWACSYSGCDGGNPDGKIWFCGIEPGGKFDFDLKDVSQPPERPKKFFKSSPYNQNTAKLYAAIVKKNLEGYRKLDVFTRDSNSFKLNLYPINLPGDRDDFWKKPHFEKTGIPTKEIYRAWCQENRFPQIRNWMKQHSPKLIVATGSSYQLDFLLAFGGIEFIYKELPPVKLSEEHENISLYFLSVNDGKTLLAITPFLGGRYGLNSYEKIRRAGEKIQEEAEKHFGENWLQPN